MIDITLDLRGAEELIGTSRKIQGLIGRTTLNAMRRVVRRRITTTKKRIRTESGLGTSIWGKKGSGLEKMVTLIKARLTPETIETGIKLKGLPKLLETGGRTKAHDITSKSGVLGPWTFNGRMMFAKTVKHPGSTIRPHGIAEAELKAAGPEVVREVDAALGKLVGNASGLLP